MFIAIFIYLITIFIIYCISMSSSNSANAGTSTTAAAKIRNIFFIFRSFLVYSVPFQANITEYRKFENITDKIFA